MEIQRAEQYVNPADSHDEAVELRGLEDLFQWASDTVSEGLDGRARRAREQRIKKQVLSIVHRNAELQAKAKYGDEIAYLNRRVIALQGVVQVRSDEVTDLKQIVLSQYFHLQRIPELEEKIVQLQATSVDKEQAEEEQRHLMNALSKLKKERDFLEEILTINETENSRLAKLLNETREECETLKNRKWWHYFFPAKK